MSYVYTDTAGNRWTEEFIRDRCLCPTSNGRDIERWENMMRRRNGPPIDSREKKTKKSDSPR